MSVNNKWQQNDWIEELENSDCDEKWQIYNW